LIPAWNTARIGPEATQALGETVEAVGGELDGAGNAEAVRNLIAEQIIGAANSEACPQSACGGQRKAGFSKQMTTAGRQSRLAI
jgi:hypothetical protein